MHRPIDLNTAGKEELMQLGEVSERLAHNLVEYRAQRGRLERVEDLAEVHGFSDETIDQIRGQVKVGRGSVADWHRHWLSRGSA